MRKTKLLTVVLTVAMLLNSCSDNPAKSKKEESGEGIYILCEGNFQSTNASLWQYDDGTVIGPIYWNESTNPLGSVGQSLHYHDGKLFIIVNASHSIEILDTETNEKIASIALPGASPRFMDSDDKIGYVTGWNNHGIITFDMNTYEILDTIAVGAFAEDIIIENNMLFTSVTMDFFWGSENKVLVYDLDMENPVAVDTFEVVTGPGQMVLDDDELWVASTYYDDAWQTYAGMSKINLDSKEVTMQDYGVNFNFSKDIVKYENKIYRTYKNGLMEINADLTYDEDKLIGTVPQKVYSASAGGDKIYIGTTDYAAPDTLYVFDNGFVIEDIKVGAIPTTVAFPEN